MSRISPKTVSNKVVSFNSQDRDRNPGQRILAECREQLVSLLSTWLTEIATPVSEELLNLADSSRERQQKIRYVSLRADIGKDWPTLVDAFRRELSSGAEHCHNQHNQDERNRQVPLEDTDVKGLQLLADEDLSELIVLREFSVQLSECCDEELYTLNRRVATLLGHEDPNDIDNPLAPSIVCRALADACAALGPDAEKRLLLLRRLERQLHLGLPLIYQQINAYLIERDILPDLKRNYRRSSATGSGYSSSSGGQSSNGQASRGQSSGGPSGSSGGSGSTDYSNAPSISGEGILEALQRLALARSGPVYVQTGTPAFGSSATPGTPVYMQAGTPGLTGSLVSSVPAAGFQGVPLDTAAINQLLLSSLNNLQQAPALNTEGAIINQVRMVRESESAQQVGGLAAVTIDIVAMLFDFILDDAHIPVAIKALISRLQIPVLKVAMLNPGFFADRQHAARRFLGSVSGISIRWGDSVDEADPFYCKLSELVERIQSEFEDDVEVFGTALAELEAFVDEREGEEDSTALTAANIVIQREQESDTWERAQRTVRTFRTATPLPVLIDTFLGEHWVRVLQAIATKNGEDSYAWQSAKETMQDLAWSVEAKNSPDDRPKLISLLPKLLDRLNRGLDSIHAPPEQRTAFFDELVKCHSAALKGEIAVEPPAKTSQVPEPGEPAPAPAPPSEEGDLLVMRSVDNGVEVEEIILVGASPIWRADDREIFRRVSELKRGDWVEFHDEEDGSYRERLHWVSPQRGILLFSNHRSAKAISITPEALARQIRDGKADIVHKEEVFERALSGALESMNAS